MKVRSVIIDSLNLEFMDSDIGKLSSHIDLVIKNNRNPIVLLNEHGDDLLRKLPKLLECDLVYSEKSTRPYEGLLTGIHGGGTCAFYLPLNVEYGDESVWSDLEKNLLKLPYMNKVHILFNNDSGPWLITPAGVLYLKSKPNGYELEKDKDLNRLDISKR